MITFFVFLVLFLLFFSLCTRDFNNPYTLNFYFGKKGSGKTTELVKLALDHLHRGWIVYTNINLPGTRSFDPLKIGQFSFPPHSVVFIDEASISWDNRGFKSFDKTTLEWFRLQRHYKVKIYLFSQTFDVDKKLRDLTDEMFLLERRFKIFCYGRRIIKKVTLTEASEDRASRIDENLKFDSFLWFWAGSRSITLLPRYSGLFDSFTVPVKQNFISVVPGDTPRAPSAAAVWLALARSGVRVLRDMVRGLGPAIARLRAISDESKHVVVDMPTQEEIDASLNQTLDDFFKNAD